MLIGVLPLILMISALFTTTSLSAPIGKSSYYPWLPVSFRSAHSSIPPDSTVELVWEGGSGNGFVS